MPALESKIEELRPANLAAASSVGEYFLSMNAFVVLVGMDLVMRLCGFHRLHRLIRGFPCIGRRFPEEQVVERLCTAVDRAATYYFKRAWCLQRSATTTCLLRLRGVPAEMVIGVKKIPFYAHAWVEVGGRVVNDHPMIQQRYTVLERC